MESITWNDLLLVGFFIIFVLVVILFLYLIKMVISLSRSANTIEGILKENKNNINETLSSIPKLTKELTDLSIETKKPVRVFGKVKNIYDIVYLLIKVFLEDKEKYDDEVVSK